MHGSGPARGDVAFVYIPRALPAGALHYCDGQVYGAVAVPLAQIPMGRGSRTSARPEDSTLWHANTKARPSGRSPSSGWRADFRVC